MVFNFAGQIGTPVPRVLAPRPAGPLGASWLGASFCRMRAYLCLPESRSAYLCLLESLFTLSTSSLSRPFFITIKFGSGLRCCYTN